MIKWPITYTTYDDETVTEDFYFNLNKAELMTMQFEANGAYSAFIERVSNERNLKALGEEFRKLILGSVGRKSDDGKRFIKSKEFAEEFEQSEAYVTLYMELITDSDKMVKFVQGILPKDLQKAVKDEDLLAQAGLPALSQA